MDKKYWSLSLVSHGHKLLIANLIDDLVRLGRSDFELILTLNLPEQLPFSVQALPFPVLLIENPIPKGFAENHNAAFSVSNGENFVVLNPDIELRDDPFVELKKLVETYPGSIFAPTVVDRQGHVEDSARNFPSPLRLVLKLLAKLTHRTLPNEKIRSREHVLMPDWVAGMFVVVPRSTYAMLGGLNEKYHMYYEDVDLCARARLAGYPVYVSKTAVVVHDARRDSHRKLQYLAWHLKSMVRFLTSQTYWRLLARRYLSTQDKNGP